MGFVKTLRRPRRRHRGQGHCWTAGGNERKLKGNDYLQQFALPNLLLRDDSVRHPAPSRRADRQAGLPRSGQLALGQLAPGQMRTVLTNATLVDCVQPRAVEAVAVVIEGGTDSRDPHRRQHAEPGGVSIDLRGAYLMPGLWDVHIHPDYYLPTRDAARRPGRAVRPSTDRGADRLGHHWAAMRRRASLHGCRLEARLRLRPVCRPAPVRQRSLPDDDRRPLPRRPGTRWNATGRTASSRRSASRSRTASTTSSSTCRAASWGRPGISTGTRSCCRTNCRWRSISAACASSR